MRKSRNRRVRKSLAVAFVGRQVEEFVEEVVEVEEQKFNP